MCTSLGAGWRRFLIRTLPHKRRRYNTSSKTGVCAAGQHIVTHHLRIDYALLGTFPDALRKQLKHGGAWAGGRLPKLVCDALDRASPDAERLGNLQDTHTVRKVLSNLPFRRTVYLRPAELHP